MIDKPGSYVISAGEYHQDPIIEPSLSCSILKKLISESPAHAFYAHPRLNKQHKEDHGEGKFDIGTASHLLVLEGPESIAVVNEKDWRKDTAKETRQLAWTEGKTPLLKHQFEETKIMAGVAIDQIMGCTDLKILDLRSQGDSELTYVWKEGESWMRSRVDWISKNRTLILDYKTTGMSANPNRIGRHITNMQYEIQDSFYKRGVKAVERKDARMIFVFQEDTEPYLCSFIEIPFELTEMGNQEVEIGILLWQECMSKGRWPGYPRKVVKSDTPKYVLMAWRERVQREMKSDQKFKGGDNGKCTDD